MNEIVNGSVDRYLDAFEVLGLPPEATPRDVKRGYRRAVARHPPDREAEVFRRVRAAYELLSRPEAGLEVIHLAEPRTRPPSVVRPPPVELARALPLAALRAVVGALDAGALIGDGRG